MPHVIKNSEGKYLVSIDENQNPVWGDNYDDAMWSHFASHVQAVIDDYAVEDASVDSGDSGSNNPGHKPPF